MKRDGRAGAIETVETRRVVSAQALIISSLIFSFAFGAQTISAQSLGDVAREQRARVQARKDAPHVYTNEDLNAEKILVPDDEQRFSGNLLLAAPAVSNIPVVIPVASTTIDPDALNAATSAAPIPPMVVPEWPAGT